MKSIFTTFNLKDPRTSKPIDLIASMQIMFEQASLTQKTLWEQTYVDKWFDFRAPQLGLTAEGILASYGVRVRASVIGNDSDTPLRNGRGFEIWSGEIPRFGHKFKMTAKIVRQLMTINENSRLNDAQKLAEIERIIVGDFRDAYLGCKDAADEIVLKALSNGGIALFDPAIDNPDGRKYEFDYGMPTTNKLLAPIEWTEANLNAVDLDVLAILKKIVYDAKSKGIEFEYILMAPKIRYWLMRTLSIRLAVLGNDKATRIVTEDEFDALLRSQRIPAIVEINKRTAYQKDGIVTNIIPWNEDVITFVPKTRDGKMGEIQPALEDDVLMPDPEADYTDAGNGILVTKWRTGVSSGQQAAEFTQGAWRAVPLFSITNAIVNLKVRNTSVPYPVADAGIPVG